MTTGQLAEKIADALFTEYQGSCKVKNRATRIQLKYKTSKGYEKSGGGWCFEAAVDEIARVIARHKP